jgi:hypothetical protein
MKKAIKITMCRGCAPALCIDPNPLDECGDMFKRELNRWIANPDDKRDVKIIHSDFYKPLAERN